MAIIVAPTLSSWVSSLRQHLSHTHQEDLAAIAKRKTALASLDENAQSTAEFINTKVEDLQLDIDYYTAFEKGMQDALQLGAMSKKNFDEAIRDISRDAKVPKQREIAILRRQKRRIIEELGEAPWPLDKRYLEICYTQMMHKIIMSRSSCTRLQKKESQFEASRFKEEVLNYYSYSCRSDNNTTEAYCQLTGCLVHKDEVRAAHIVPKSLDAHEIGYLFGEGENPSTNPRNALVLLAKLQQGMDAGVICFVPRAGTGKWGRPETKWMCLLTDERMRNVQYSPRATWGEVDGKYLIFLGASSRRPAARYLYFRFLVTYLYHKNNGNVAWALKHESKDSMWPTPGPWVRKSMIGVLARTASDYFLPDAVLEEEIKGTFTISEIAMRPAAEEHDAAIFISMALEAEMTLARKEVNGEFSYEDKEDEDEDDEDEDDEDEDDEDNDDEVFPILSEDWE